MKINKKGWYVSISSLILAIILLVSLLCFKLSLFPRMTIVPCVYSIIVYMLCTKKIKDSGLNTFGCIGVILLYVFLSEFGLCIVTEIFGRESLTYPSRVLEFLDLSMYANSMYLADMAMIIYTLGATYGAKKFTCKFDLGVNEPTQNDIYSKLIYIIGMLFLAISMLFMLALLFSGVISLSMDYSSYRQTMFDDNSFYQYVIILYSFGATFVFAVADKRKMVYGGVLFGVTALLLLMTGNRGEVLYPALAVFGVLNVRGIKIKKLYIIAVVAGLVFLIPFIFSARHNGGWSSLANYSVSIKESIISTFSEIGLQIRLTVYILRDFAVGSRKLIYGFSYYEFIPRWLSKFIPGIYNAPVDFNFKSAYASMGFNQIAESYANGGVIGVLIFHFVLGRIMGNMEQKVTNCFNVAILGACCSVFINMTRNKFAFVPTYLIFIFVIYWGVKIIAQRKRDI